MRKIPLNIRKQISEDNFYRTCCVADEICFGKIEIHHNMIYAGKQVDDLFALLPVCLYHHEREKCREIGDKLDKVMISRMTIEDEKKFDRINWLVKKQYLDNIKTP